ncbi:hypothetical protein Tco_0216489 [Tanacetum coccineum]
MTNKIDIVLKAINDRITGTLLSDTVKNPKLNVNSTSPVLSARSYPTKDPHCSPHSLNSIKAIKTCSRQTSNLQTDQLQMVNQIGTSKPKEPTKALEDEFKDLILNLPVLEVLAHALMYNAMLDKYVESLELEKIGIGFLATANAVIDYRKAKIAVGEGVTRSIFRVKEIDLGEEEESKDLIENMIDWNKPPKRGDEARHAKIRLIDPYGEEFTKTFQSIPTTRKLSEKENPCEIIELDHFS